MYAEDGEYKYGMEIKGTVVLSKPSKPQNEAEYDMQTAYLRQGIGYTAYTVYSDELQVTDFRQDVYG